MEYLAVSIYIESFAGTCLKKKNLPPLNLCLCICLNEETLNRWTLLPKQIVIFIILIWFVKNIDIDWFMYMFIKFIISGNASYTCWFVFISGMPHLCLFIGYLCQKKCPFVPQSCTLLHPDWYFLHKLNKKSSFSFSVLDCGATSEMCLILM